MLTCFCVNIFILGVLMKSIIYLGRQLIKVHPIPFQCTVRMDWEVDTWKCICWLQDDWRCVKWRCMDHMVSILNNMWSFYKTKACLEITIWNVPRIFVDIYLCWNHTFLHSQTDRRPGSLIMRNRRKQSVLQNAFIYLQKKNCCWTLFF